MNELEYFDAKCAEYAEEDDAEHPLDLKVVGEPVRIIGSLDGYHNAPMKLNGVRATVLRPSAIESFVFVWIEDQYRQRQIHVSCLRSE